MARASTSGAAACVFAGACAAALAAGVAAIPPLGLPAGAVAELGGLAGLLAAGLLALGPAVPDCAVTSTTDSIKTPPATNSNRLNTELPRCWQIRTSSLHTFISGWIKRVKRLTALQSPILRGFRC